MLRIFDDILDWLEWLAPRVKEVGRSDPNLAGQLRRAATSVSLNVSEGMGARGGSKRRAYRVALGEMREAQGAIEVAVRLRYVGSPDPAEHDRMQKILATLIRLAKPWEE